MPCGAVRQSSQSSMLVEERDNLRPVEPAQVLMAASCNSELHSPRQTRVVASRTRSTIIKRTSKVGGRLVGSWAGSNNLSQERSLSAVGVAFDHVSEDHDDDAPFHDCAVDVVRRFSLPDFV
jgi:hypothetical protein